MTLELEVNRHFKGLQPGQHLNVSAQIEGAWVTRSYSPTNVTPHRRRLSLTVKEVPGGRMSTHLCREIGVGDVLELGAAFGQMTWPDAAASSRWLFLAAGSGITPLMCLLRSADWAAGAEVCLFYSARHRSELCFVDELRQLAADQPGLSCHFVLSGEAAGGADEVSGRIDAKTITDRMADLEHRQVYACGPSGYVSSLSSQLSDQVQGFMAEAFSPPEAAAVSTAATGTVRVELRRSGRTLELAQDRSILEALEAQGLQPEHGCRMGLCNTCACEKTSGSTQDLFNGEVDGEASSALRLCRNRAVSDLVLDL